MMTVFSKNLKRFRTAKSMTQEQAAAVLGVSTQSVSRWECGTTLPDVSMLPAIAKLYCITIDDLYQETSIPYDNYAQRLLGIYESTQKPEDFLRADMEFRRLIRSGDHTNEDLRQYGILHQDMMHYCMEQAAALYDRVLRKGPAEDPKTYWRTKHQQGFLLYEIGRNQENIDYFLPLVRAGSRDLNEWLCLIQAYDFAGDYQAAWDWAEKAERQFPENATLHVFKGDLCRTMKRYEEAFAHWNRARELEPKWLDAAYSMGECYEELGDYENAYQIFCGIVDDLISRGYESEVVYPRSLAARCKEKLSS